MKITTTKTVEETLEVTLPAFRKYGPYFIKIISEEKSIEVKADFNGENSISYRTQKHPALNKFLTEGEEISEEQFDNILIDTKSKINAFIMESYLTEA